MVIKTVGQGTNDRPIVICNILQIQIEMMQICSDGDICSRSKVLLVLNEEIVPPERIDSTTTMYHLFNVQEPLSVLRCVLQRDSGNRYVGGLDLQGGRMYSLSQKLEKTRAADSESGKSQCDNLLTPKTERVRADQSQTQTININKQKKLNGGIQNHKTKFWKTISAKYRESSQEVKTNWLRTREDMKLKTQGKS